LTNKKADDDEKEVVDKVDPAVKAAIMEPAAVWERKKAFADAFIGAIRRIPVLPPIVCAR
jgi:hypothetical protein